MKYKALALILIFSVSTAFAQNGPAVQSKSKVTWEDVEETPTDLAGFGILDAAKYTDLPNNASFTLAGLGEKSFSSLTDKPTTLSGYGITDAITSEDLPTNSDFTLSGLSEKSFSSLTDKPTTLSGYGITDAITSEDLPTNSDFTLSGLSEKSFSSLTNTPTTLSGYGITEVVSSSIGANYFRDTLNNMLIGNVSTKTMFSTGSTGRNTMEFYPVGTGDTISGTPTLTLNSDGASVTGEQTVSPGSDCMRKVLRVELTSGAKTDLMYLLGCQNMPCGELRVVCTTTDAAINVVMNGSNTVTKQYGTNSAATDEAGKLCVYFDSDAYAFQLKNDLFGTRAFIIEYLGRN